MRKIGILGGTFDPVHNAHLELARLAIEQYHLDFVLFIPTGMPVRKLATTHASAMDRLQMLEIACAGVGEFRVSPIEVNRQEVTYTIDTLRELKSLFGRNSELYLILGEDTATDLATWKDSSEIAKLVKVLYARRPGTEANATLPEGYECKLIEMAPNAVSSSALRAALENNEAVDEYLPAEVLTYIKKYGLYGKL